MRIFKKVRPQIQIRLKSVIMGHSLLLKTNCQRRTTQQTFQISLRQSAPQRTSTSSNRTKWLTPLRPGLWWLRAKIQQQHCLFRRSSNDATKNRQQKSLRRYGWYAHQTRAAKKRWPLQTWSTRRTRQNSFSSLQVIARWRWHRAARDSLSLSLP